MWMYILYSENWPIFYMFLDAMIAKQIAEEVLRYDFVDGDAPSPRYIKAFELIIA